MDHANPAAGPPATFRPPFAHRAHPAHGPGCGAPRLATALAIVAGLVLARPTTSMSATLLWNNAGGGQAGVAANWNPAVVPTEADVLRFDMPNTYTVTFGAVVDSVLSHHLWSGDVTLNFNTPHGGRNQFYVGSQAGNSVTARLTDGTLRMGYIAEVGTGTGASGTLRVFGGTSRLDQNVSGGAAWMDVGGDDVNAGTGEVVVLAGGVMELAGELRLGRHVGGTGTMRVKGIGSTGTGLRRSHVFTNASTADAFVGWQGGHGTLEVTEGGLARFGHDLRLAEAAGDVADVTIGGENVIDSSEVHVLDDLFVCANPSSSAGAAGGTANLVLDSLGVLVVDDSTVVGDADGSSALLTLRPGSRMWTRHLALQQTTSTTLDLGGLLQVEGGSLSTGTQRLTLAGATGAPALPSLQLLGGTTATFAGSSLIPSLTIATSGEVGMRIDGGSQVVANGGAVKLATGSSSFGLLRIANGGQLTSDQAAIVGATGEAELVLEPNGTASFAGLDLGPGPGSYGNVLIDTGAQLTSTGPLNLGGSTLVAGERGWVTVLAGGELHLTSPGGAGTIWPAPVGESRLRVDTGGLVELAGTLTVRDRLDMAGGDVNGGAISLRGAGVIEGDGTVASSIVAGTDTTVAIVSTGTLSVGRSDPAGSFLMRGSVEVGDVSLVIQDPDSAIVGNVSLTGGTLELPVLGGVVESGKRLVGHGTVLGPVWNRGTIIGDAVQTLRFDGMIHGLGQGVSGRRLAFLSGGGFEGAGLVDAAMDMGVGSRLVATGDLTAGRGGIGNISFWNSRIEVGSHVVTLLGLSPIVLGGEIVLEGGRLTAQGIDFSALAGSVFRGSGVVEGQTTTLGRLSPGPPAGRLHWTGNLLLAGGSTFEADLGLIGAAEFDTLEATGNVQLSAGTTLALRRLATFDAEVGDSFRVVTCASLTGTFDVVTLDGVPLAGELDVHYAPDGVWLVVMQPVTAVDDAPGVPAPPTALRLSAFGTPGTHAGVTLALPEAAPVTLDVFDVLGRTVGHLHDGWLGAGVHRHELPRELAGAGTYFVRAVVRGSAGPWARTIKLTSLR